MLSKRLFAAVIVVGAVATPAHAQNLLEALTPNFLTPKTICFIQHQATPATVYVGPDGRSVALTRQQCDQANALAQQMELQEQQQREQQKRAEQANAAGPAQTQQRPKAGDPYADLVIAARAKEAQQKWEIFLGDVRVIYFAVGCSVVSEQDAQPLISERFSYFVSRPWIRWDRPTMDNARLQGLDRAKKPDGCAFWRQNPDNLLAMRQAAQAAVSRVIAGYSPPLAPASEVSPISVK